MKVRELSFENYRNLCSGTFTPDAGVNVIWGSNAQGKTNLLEAIWLFTGGHSFRGSRDADLVRREPDGKPRESARLELKFSGGGREQVAEIKLQNGRRAGTLNGVGKRTASALVGAFCAVVFSPEHLSLVKDGPSERRSFLDSAICQLRPSYAGMLNHYNRTLQQRNSLLKDIPRHGELLDTLEIWDERLAGFGAGIMAERQRYVKRLAPEAGHIYLGISRQKEELGIQYQMTAAAEETAEEQYRQAMVEALRRCRRDDLGAGFTTVGPHRDDLLLTINGAAARVFGSQGQQRSAVLALKLAEAAVLEEIIGEPPVVLLDDVMSELDTQRQEYLLNHLEGRQIFITCCDPANVRLLEHGGVFQVQEGEILQEAEGKE